MDGGGVLHRLDALEQQLGGTTLHVGVLHRLNALEKGILGGSCVGGSVPDRVTRLKNLWGGVEPRDSAVDAADYTTSCHSTGAGAGSGSDAAPLVSSNRSAYGTGPDQTPGSSNSSVADVPMVQTPSPFLQSRQQKHSHGNRPNVEERRRLRRKTEMHAGSWFRAASNEQSKEDQEQQPGAVEYMAEDMVHAQDKLLELSKIGNMLSNERTLLAWLRTLVSIFGWAITISNLGLQDMKSEDDKMAWAMYVLSLLIAALSIGIFFWGAQRYHRTKEALLNPDQEAALGTLNDRLEMKFLLIPFSIIAVAGFGAFVTHTSHTYNDAE